PTGPGGSYEFIDKVTGGVIPKEYIPSVDAGIQEAMQGGVLAGYPTVDIRVTLTYGSYHEVYSSEMAFKIAGSLAFKKAARAAQPVLLEPIMAVEVVPPEDHMGDVSGDPSSRRGQAAGRERRGPSQATPGQGPRASAGGRGWGPARERNTRTWRSRSSSAPRPTSTWGRWATSTTARPPSPRPSPRCCTTGTRAWPTPPSTRSTRRPRRSSGASPSPSPMWSTRPTSATTRTST